MNNNNNSKNNNSKMIITPIIHVNTRVNESIVVGQNKAIGDLFYSTLGISTEESFPKLIFRFRLHIDVTDTSNPPEEFLEKDVLKICSKLKEENPCRNLI